MSWQAYVDSNLVGTGMVKQAAILGLDGSTWATSGGFQVNPAEGSQISASFKDPNVARSKGINVGGVKYIALRADDASLYGKKGAGGVCIVKTKQAVLVGVYDESIQPGQCTTVVEKLGDYLKEQGY